MIRSRIRHTLPLRRACGFTLVEMLVAIALMALVGAATAAVVSGGFKVIERVRGSGSASEQEIRVVLSGVEQDLRNASPFAPIPFKGEYDGLTFPALLRQDLTDGSVIREVGRQGYFIGAGGVLFETKDFYPGLDTEVWGKDRARPLLFGIDRLRFSYYALGEGSSEPKWTSSYAGVRLPLAVKIEVEYHDEANKPKRQARTVRLAAGR